MDADLVEMLRLSLRKVLAESEDRPLGPQLAELGWDEVVAGDPAGARRLLFEARGATLAGADVLGATMVEVLTADLGLSLPAGAGLVLAPSLRADEGAVAVDAGTLALAGVTPSVAALAAGAAAVAPAFDGATVALAVLTDGGIECQPVDGVDRRGGLARVSASAPAAGVIWLDTPEVAPAWTAAVATGRCGLAAELLAVASGIVETVVAYTGERRQYGKPIGSFQALQHRLAAAHATVQGALAVTDEAWATGDPWAALVAKALAGRAAEAAATQAQQAYGAIGFTWEHEFHDHLRRIYVLDRLLGDWRTLEAEIGAELRTSGRAPKIGAL